ncbi:MAG: carboxypeptidase-like regulatory domain-containing protein [Candidatus Sabulitectum sp.]|nr:carboxypeptidase-like regulatory domain-containing protein [Candidatus Sabulitectum sp.]
MILFYLFTAILVGPPAEQTDSLYSISGNVLDYDGNPLVGATVMVVGTALGTMTGTEGNYLINDIPVDRGLLRSSMVGMGEYSFHVIPLPGDTVHADVTLFGSGSYFFSLDQKRNGETYRDTVEIVIDNWRELDVDHSQIWSQNQPVPGWKLNDSTVVAALPGRAESFTISVFPAPAVQLDAPESGSTISVTCDLSTGSGNEYTAEGIQTRYNFIDMTEWGNNTLEDWGLLGIEVIYTNSGDPRILLVYCENAVLIDESGSEIVIEYPFPTFHYRTDSNLKYLLVWDLFGQYAVSGDIAVISLENGESTVFDPTPEIDESMMHNSYGGCMVISAERIPLRGKFHVTSSGQVFRLDNSYYRSFHRNGSVICCRPLEDLGLEAFFYTDQFLSLDQTALSAVFTDGSLNYCITVNTLGDVLNFCTIPVPIQTNVTRWSPHDPESAVIWKPLEMAGIARIDCLSGECIYRPGLRTSNICASHNFQLLGVTLFDNTMPGYKVHELWDWNTSERIYSSREPYSQSQAVVSISNLGHSLCRRGSRQIGSEFLLTDSAGSLIWRIPTLSTRFNPEYTGTVSPDGELAVVPSGKYLIFVDIRKTREVL